MSHFNDEMTSIEKLLYVALCSEWSDRWGPDGKPRTPGTESCPFCSNWKRQGAHQPRCYLALAIQAARGAGVDLTPPEPANG